MQGNPPRLRALGERVFVTRASVGPYHYETSFAVSGAEILNAMDLLQPTEYGLNDAWRLKAASLQKGNHLCAAVEGRFPVEEILLLPLLVDSAQRTVPVHEPDYERPVVAQHASSFPKGFFDIIDETAVSYTHLTLPTN